MRTHLIAAIAFVLLTAFFLNAQTPKKKPVKASAPAVVSHSEPIDFEFEVSLTPEGLAGILARRRSGMALFTPKMVNSFAKYFYREQAARPTTSKASESPSFVIRPDKGSRMEETLEVINAVRVSPKTEVRIEVDAGLAIFVPKKPDPKGAPPKPNPLFLLVKIDERFNIVLNNEPQGSLSDTSKLEQYLRQIFRERAENGVWREGTTTTDTTILIKLDKKMTFANLVEVARALSRAGSDSIGLQVDETNMIVSVEMIQP